MGGGGLFRKFLPNTHVYTVHIVMCLFTHFIFICICILFTNVDKSVTTSIKGYIIRYALFADWKVTYNERLDQHLFCNILHFIDTLPPLSAHSASVGLWRQKRVSRAGKSNCIRQYSVRCNYLSSFWHQKSLYNIVMPKRCWRPAFIKISISLWLKGVLLETVSRLSACGPLPEW